jgi:hypothetical protein
MSILSTDLLLYGPASNPTDDVSASGGAIDATRRPVFTQLLANSVLVYQSSSADKRTVTSVGRDSTGAVQQETVTLNGTIAVSGAQVFERLQSVNCQNSGTGQNVTIGGSGIGVGGGGLANIPANEVGFYMMFRNAFSTSSIQSRYEKTFWKNNNGSLSLTSATITLTADPSGVLQLGLATAENDSVSLGNRLGSAPGGVSFVGVGVAQAIPVDGVLESGDAMGTWILQALAVNNAPIRNSFTTQLAGNTT